MRKVYEGDIVSKYSGFRIPLLGYILTFLTTQLGFFLCIVLPVLLYTIWQVYKFVVVLMNNQKVKLMEEVKGQTSEEEKQAIIAEYLAQQKMKEEDNESNTK